MKHIFLSGRFCPYSLCFVYTALRRITQDAVYDHRAIRFIFAALALPILPKQFPQLVYLGKAPFTPYGLRSCASTRVNHVPLRYHIPASLRRYPALVPICTLAPRHHISHNAPCPSASLQLSMKLAMRRFVHSAPRAAVSITTIPILLS